MLKLTLLAAFAAVSVCAIAQDRYDEDSKIAIDANGKSHYDIKREVCRQEEYLSGGDAYTFEAMLNRMQGNTEDALISGLFAAHRQAVLIKDQIIASRFPDSSVGDQAVLAQETDSSMRPMRMVMDEPRHHRDMNYGTAFDILTADLNSTQTTWLAQWWDDATDREKDIVVRLLKLDASKADDPIYASVYTNVKYDWVNQ
jgi:hypothetical protein